MSNHITPQEAVANGLAVLNTTLGKDWVKQIDLDNLHMSSGAYLPAAYDAYGKGACGCLMAQLNYDGNALGDGAPLHETGDYVEGVQRLKRLITLAPCTGEEWNMVTFARLHGFLAPDFSDDAAEFAAEFAYYNELQSEWTRVITAQLSELS